MDINLTSGRYAIAVSGGIDSVVLLDLLSKKPDVELVVAHFNHGIRASSAKDAIFVQALAKKYGLKHELGHGKLGPRASEEKARNARYTFLRQVVSKHELAGIITAHHQDDLIETALINMIRGTGSAGLFSLSDSTVIRRPMLGYTKEQIRTYAQEHKLKWVEDETNNDTRYLRNYLRMEVVSRLTKDQRTNLLINIEKVAELSTKTNRYFATLSHIIEKNNQINRSTFSQLDSRVGEGYLHYKMNKVGDIDRKTIRRINVAIRTAKSGSKTNIVGDKFLATSKEYAWVE